MKRTTLIVGLAGVCTATALAASASASNAATCVAGVTKVAGVPARTFCGPAKANVKLDGKTISYAGGTCSTSIGLFSINVGTVVLGNVSHAPEYFGVTAKAKAGTNLRQTIAVVHGGKTRAIIGTVTLKPGLKGGTFAGKVFGSAKTVSGTFSC